MKYFYLIGGSGSGKSTLAKNLEIMHPNYFHRVLELTTREKREGEVEGVDYEFVTKDEIRAMKGNNELFEIVEHQFLPTIYGGKWKELDNEKWNVVVASIEGIFSGLTNLKEEDECIIMNIVIDDNLDVEREGRNPDQEQSYNLSVLRNVFSDYNKIKNQEKDYFVYNNCNVNYFEINLSELKEIRNSAEGLKAFFERVSNIF